MQMAVNPMAIPVRTRLKTGLGRTWCSREPGYSRRATTVQAETMKIPNSAASIKYSGQCFLSDFIIGVESMYEPVVPQLCRWYSLNDSVRSDLFQPGRSFLELPENTFTTVGAVDRNAGISAACRGIL